MQQIVRKGSHMISMGLASSLVGALNFWSGGHEFNPRSGLGKLTEGGRPWGQVIYKTYKAGLLGTSNFGEGGRESTLDCREHRHCWVLSIFFKIFRNQLHWHRCIATIPPEITTSQLQGVDNDNTVSFAPTSISGSLPPFSRRILFELNIEPPPPLTHLSEFVNVHKIVSEYAERIYASVDKTQRYKKLRIS